MKKYIWIFSLLIYMLAACVPAPDAIPSDISPTPEDPLPLTPAQSATIAALSDITGLPADQITLTSTEAVTWSDGCLGVQRMGMMCTQAIVEGFKIVLSADGESYEFHTNQNGSVVIIAEGVQTSKIIEKAVMAQLADNLGLQISDVILVSNEAVEFGDACLGVSMNDTLCAQAITPGNIIILEADGMQYEYHVSADGTRIQPATLALTWTREGGIAGFCDSLTVFLSGEVYANRCGGEPNEAAGTFASLLSSDERKQFTVWVKEFGHINLDESDPKGVSDRMEIKLAFYGNGNGVLKKSNEEALLLWAQELFQKLYS